MRPKQKMVPRKKISAGMTAPTYPKSAAPANAVSQGKKYKSARGNTPVKATTLVKSSIPVIASTAAKANTPVKARTPVNLRCL